MKRYRFLMLAVLLTSHRAHAYSFESILTPALEDLVLPASTAAFCGSLVAMFDQAKKDKSIIPLALDLAVFLFVGGKMVKNVLQADVKEGFPTSIFLNVYFLTRIFKSTRTK